MQWIMAQLEPNCSEKSKPVWYHNYVKAFVKGTDIKGWFGLKIHIHLLQEQARMPLQVLSVYNIKEEEK